MVNCVAGERSKKYAKKYFRSEKEEIEMVSKVAFESNILKVSSIESMLKTKSYLYYYTQQTSVNNPCLNRHENIRGGAYYAKSDI
jgi:hypothetical protein